MKIMCSCSINHAASLDPMLINSSELFVSTRAAAARREEWDVIKNQNLKCINVWRPTPRPQTLIQY